MQEIGGIDGFCQSRVIAPQRVASKRMSAAGVAYALFFVLLDTPLRYPHQVICNVEVSFQRLAAAPC